MNKKNFSLLLMTLFLVLVMPMTVLAKTPPKVMYGYVGNILSIDDIEDKYNILLTHTSDVEIFNSYGECNKAGNATIKYWDYDKSAYGTFTMNVSYNKSLRMIGIRWSLSGKNVQVTLKNISEKPLTIYSSGAKFSAKKKSQSRNMKLAKGSKVTVKPGQKKVIKFKLKGSRITTSVKKKGNWFVMKCGYKGKKYSIRLNLAPNTCNFYGKIGGSWKEIDTKCKYWI